MTSKKSLDTPHSLTGPLAAVLIVFGACSVVPGTPEFQLAPLFSDSMVVQQRSLVPVWGTAPPGSRVTVSTTWGDSGSTVADAHGVWSLDLRTPPAGGPYRITIAHGDTVEVLDDVLSGEVWLCSGQSNMEMPLEGWPPQDTVMNAAAEISGSSVSSMRLFTVQRAFSVSPEPVCRGAWVACAPQTSRSFSATAYFFGRMLSDSLRVPIGLIHASWGGTAAESWMSEKTLSKVQGFEDIVARLQDTRIRMPELTAWLNRFPVVDVSARAAAGRWEDLDFGDEKCASPEFPDSPWPEMSLPTLWEKAGLGTFDGAVWFRRHVTIPADWLHKDLVLELGPIDDIDRTFVNGIRVGSHEEEGMWNTPRVYTLRGETVTAARLVIAVRVIDYQGGGGLYGEPESFRIHPAGQSAQVSLAGVWKYLPVAEFAGGAFSVFGAEGLTFLERPRLPLELSGYSPTVLFNAMISPLTPAKLAGVIWYQGESNTGNPQQYKTLFPLLIEDWRSAFRNSRLPFYFVQIAPYGYTDGVQSQYLREAQLHALSVENTGMAVALDIGDSATIHPANKQEVGRRLARIALARDYGRPVPWSGPVLRTAQRRGAVMELTFDNAEGGLVLKEGRWGNEFRIAGDDRVFKSAQLRIRGATVFVSHPGITVPRSVRYAFRNSPEATLFNRAGLPASSFRTDEWEN